MDRKDRKIEIINEIEMQISKMDNKAGLLISALGIVFALSIDLISVFSIDGFKDLNITFVILCYVFCFLYVTSFLFSMSMFILTIFPRKKRKSIGPNKIYVPNYYYDLSELQTNNETQEQRNIVFNKLIDEDIKTDNCLDDQIFINATICRKKHDFLSRGTIGLIAFAVFFVALVVMNIIGVQL